MNEAEKTFIVEYLQDTQRRLKVGADDGILRIVRYGLVNGYSNAEIAYMLATAWHETAEWMQPIREGCSRQGPAGTDAQAVSAIQSAINRGLIKHNYLVQNAGVRHYGRGLVQITWLANYLKFEKILGKPLVLQPDLALGWDIALFIMYTGCAQGLFTGKKLSDYFGTVPTVAGYTNARAVVNGDVSRNGRKIALDATVWYAYLVAHESALRKSYAPQSALLTFLSTIMKGLFK